MKFFKRYSVIFFAIVLLFSLVPFQAIAVDPVSAGVMANAFAQAIASYGAANGVAMTFDVTDTDGIGETVHELWKDFREGTQSVDDYATLAQAIFHELYYKTSTSIATAADAVAVGVHISSEYAEEFDNFYNWLLSGPAEMVQVDNQYFQFSQAQIGPDSSPVSVYSSGVPFSSVPFISSPSNNQATFDSSYQYLLGSGISYGFFSTSSSPDVFAFTVSSVSNGTLSFHVVCCSSSSVSIRGITKTFNNYRLDSYTTSLSSAYQVEGVTQFYYHDHDGSTNNWNSVGLPSFPSVDAGLTYFSSFLDDPSSVSDNVGVKAYNSSGIADIPDTADPNYDALNRAKDIPLNIPWDDALYGDGTGTLTDAQSAAIAGDLTQALETDRTVELVEEQDIPIQPDYSDVLLPLIPINVPSFNFSLSGIWHYVRSWVTSLGAWLSMMFSVWGILPYSIVVPVYACMVIVIVLGLYKRFFM